MVDVGVWLRDRISRRSILTGSLAAVGGTAIAARSALGQSAPHAGHDTAAGHGTAAAAAADAAPQHMNGAMVTVGEVDNAANGFDPILMLTDWERGTVSVLPDGRTLRTFEMTAVDKTIEIAPGVTFPAWTYNGRVPGPALRAKEGERIRVVFKNNGSHPHSMLRGRPPLWTFAGLVLLAGGPAVLGMWLGSLAYAPQWSALALAIGAGAILQVIVEVGAYLMRRNQKGLDAFFTPPVMGGLAAGIAFMYATAALVKV